MNKHFGAALLFLLAAAHAPESALSQGPPPHEVEHGTCAIVLANPERMAFIVDSRLTPMTLEGTTKSCSAKPLEGCKVVLVRKDLLVGVTGVFIDPGVEFDAAKETEKIIRRLPKVLEKQDLNKASEQWLRTVANHYYGTKGAKMPKEGTIVSVLLIATRIHDIPYVLQVPIDFHAATGFGLDSRNLLFTDLVPQLFYAGSCRDYVGTQSPTSLTQRSPPAHWDPAARWRLNRIAEERSAGNSINDMTSILARLEEVFTEIGETTGLCYIGPPYDVATWDKGESGWTTHFKKSCDHPLSHARSTPLRHVKFPPA